MPCRAEPTSLAQKPARRTRSCALSRCLSIRCRTCTRRQPYKQDRYPSLRRPPASRRPRFLRSARHPCRVIYLPCMALASRILRASISSGPDRSRWIAQKGCTIPSPTRSQWASHSKPATQRSTPTWARTAGRCRTLTSLLRTSQWATPLARRGALWRRIPSLRRLRRERREFQAPSR